MYSRRQNVDNFYNILWEAEQKFGLWDCKKLAEAHLSNKFYDSGVYFFYEPGELRAGHKNWGRIVRVGTHRVSLGKTATLFDRLKNHFGKEDGSGGNSSIFRVHVGSAMTGKADWWTGQPLKYTEKIQKEISRFMGALKFVVLPVNDDSGSDSDRSAIEKGTIALLSNYNVEEFEHIDPPSTSWLGARCITKSPERISRSGLWNVHHVKRFPDPGVLELMNKWLKNSTKLQ